MGTFPGVFTPSILTILGIILFRRLGFVVGEAGLAKALVIILLANTISVLTSISLSAIATNFRVGRGGDYYLISRTLGVEFGGAIGVVLFLAQSVSVAFYCIGFGEAVAGLIPSLGPEWPRLIAAGSVVVLFLFAWLGADWASRFQYLVMAFLGAALVSFVIGGFSSWNPELLRASWSGGEGGFPFWMVFAIFFPAVTGFTQGVSMSGELKDPGRSLPLGTFAAVGISSVVYVGAALLFAAGLPGHVLRENYSSMGLLARYGWLIDSGVIAATLSSGMASFLGAPRILQSLSADRVIRFLLPFAEGSGKANNPRRGVLLTCAIALVTIALGNLNVIAPVVSMFFLISYGLLNYATFYEARSASPAFRPRFRWFDARLSLLGALGCLGAMLAVSPAAGAIAVALLFAIYQYLKRTAGPARWADGSRAHLFQKVREHLFAMDAEVSHLRDWRPQIVALSKNDHQREQLLRFASWIEGGSGLTTAAEIIEGDREERRQKRTEVEEALQSQIREMGIEAFSRVITAPDLRTGIDLLLQAYGVGPMRANIVLLNWIEQAPGGEDLSEEREYGRYLREGLRLGCNLVVLDAQDEEWEAIGRRPEGPQRIDIWWSGDSTSHLMLLLAYLMTRTPEWEHARLRLVLSCPKKNRDVVVDALGETLREVRIDADIFPVDEDADSEAWTGASRDASTVFLPMHLRGNLPVDPFGEPLEGILTKLPVVALVLAGEEIRLDVGPDEGKAVEVAEAEEALREAEREAGRAEKDREKTEEQVRKDQEKVLALQEGPAEEVEEEMRESRRRLEDSKAAANKAARRAERARARLESAAERARSVGIVRPTTPEGRPPSPPPPESPPSESPR